MYKWLWSKYYDKIMRDAEEKGLRDWRQSLLKNIAGDVLELGCGTGANLEFYPTTIKRLVLIEPNRHMYQRLKEKKPFQLLNNSSIEILNDKAENISLENSSVDIVICTLVLCSVKNLDKALSEIYRILRPQGKLIFIEHIAATNNPTRNKWQHRLEFLWKHIADGCHLTRRTDEAIIKAGFKMIEIHHQSMRGVPPIARPGIRGVAQKI